MENKTIVKSGNTIGVLLTVAFVVLKLCHIIDWSWWWVVSPILIQWGITIILLILLFIIQVIIQTRK